MAIGSSDLSIAAKKGWAWNFTGDAGANFSIWEPLLKSELERQGNLHNIRRLENDEVRSGKVAAIREALRQATDDQVAAIISLLGL